MENVFAALLFIIIIGLLYFDYKNKQLNMLIYKKQEELGEINIQTKFTNYRKLALVSTCALVFLLVKGTISNPMVDTYGNFPRSTEFRGEFSEYDTDETNKSFIGACPIKKESKLSIQGKIVQIEENTIYLSSIYNDNEDEYDFVIDVNENTKLSTDRNLISGMNILVYVDVITGNDIMHATAKEILIDCESE